MPYFSSIIGLFIFNILKSIKIFAESLRPMCSDRFASHILQKVISSCSDRGNPEDSTKTEDSAQFNSLALKFCKYLLNNAEEFVWDTYANHILRTVVQSLSGLFEVEQKSPGKSNKKVLERRKVNEEFTTILLQYCEKISNWPQILEFGHDELTSGFLQSILRSLKDIDPKATNSTVKTIVSKCFTSHSEDSPSNAFASESAARLLETCLEVSKAKRYNNIYESFFEGKLKTLALTRESNFCVQRLLDYCPTKEELEKIYDEISEHMEAILHSGHSGVLSSLANACLRLKGKQGPFMNAICDVLHCSKPEERQSRMVVYVSRLNTFEQFERLQKENPNPPLNLHGSLILQAMLRFNKPIKVVNSLLALESEELVHLFGDPKGSRILDAFIDSEFVGEKSRDKLIRKLKGYWVQLANSDHGSRCLDKIWEGAQKTQRTAIMGELEVAGQSLKSSKCGKIIYNKLNVALFSRSQKEWHEARGKKEKIKNMFADIIAPTVSK